MNRLDQGSFALVADGKRLESVSREKNMVGFCSSCESELESLAYHRAQAGWLVCARCQKEHLTLMSYDQEWNWLSDQELEICEDEASISCLPKEKLDAIFTPAEIRDMLAFEQGQPYTRQNLYRARAKFERFKKLFGTKINL